MVKIIPIQEMLWYLNNNNQLTKNKKCPDIKGIFYSKLRFSNINEFKQISVYREAIFLFRFIL